MSETGAETELLKKRFAELSQRAYRTGAYTYSAFLSPAEQALLLSMKKQLGGDSFCLWGGARDCERRMAAFGGGEEYESGIQWPIACLLISPRGVKFAEAMGHRDYLGALMSLGIERGVLGDIVVRTEGAYLFCGNSIAKFICDNLEQIKHTAVCCKSCEALPEGKMYTRLPETVQVNAPRADALISRAYKLSREGSLELFRAKKVFINSASCENNSRMLEDGDIVSVRGYGRFAFCGVKSISKKGKLNISIEKYSDGI